MNDWIHRCYSRILIDNHISEDDPEAMTRFDPERYAAMIKKSGVDAAMVYASCHNGNCYYPTKVGHMHANLRGRDIYGQTVAALRHAGITPVAYYTSIYHNHSAKTHPAWRITLPSGAQHGGRYWWCCPNNAEYRSFVKAQIAEVVVYDVAGIFNDMTFWPGICVCAACREKFLRATGREIPTKIDWADPHWVAFQRFRERSMADFVREITQAIRGVKDLTVTHQTSTLLHGWMWGYSLDIAAWCDYTSGDFYGGKYQHVIGAKALAAASLNQPYDFFTSRCVNLHDHTSMKSEAELTCEAATTLANAGAYFFIDAINPDGTLEDAVYERLAHVSRTLAPFTAALKQHRPVITADTALYYSPASYVDANTSTNIMAETPSNPVADELFGTSIILTRNHRPFQVVHARTPNFDGLKTLILNNIAYTSPEENARLREFVQNGGTLLATGLTSLYTPEGQTTGDFALADVFGVSYTGQKSKRCHYLQFTDRPGLVCAQAVGPLVTAIAAQVLARINEPRFDPDAPQYASIHSNPPGILTAYAGLTVHAFGQGRCIYLSAPVLSFQQDAQQTFGAWLLTEYAPSNLITTNAPPCVEITLNQSTTAPAYLLGLVNYQKEQPNVPVHNLTITLRLPAAPKIKAARLLSANAALPFQQDAGAVTLNIARLDTLEMIELTC